MFLFPGIVGSVIHAQGVHISTSVVRINASPGADIKGNFLVSLSTQTVHDLEIPGEVVLETSVKTWFMPEENKDVRTSSWLSVYPETLSISSGTVHELTYRVSVPMMAQGYLAGMITLETLPPEPEPVVPEEEAPEEEDFFDDEFMPDEPEEQDTVVTEAEPVEIVEEEQPVVVYSVPVYLIIQGTETMDGKLVNLSAQRSKEGKKINLSLSLENTGNIIMFPEIVTLTLEPKRRAFFSEHEDEHDAYQPIVFSDIKPIFPSMTGSLSAELEYPAIEQGRYRLLLDIVNEYPEVTLQRAYDITVMTDEAIQIDNQENREEE
ncbi:MAG: hypothetical protein GF384_04565 [Elusimicrobia bacterium]|nr:hypothetical protein [Elusimicrobiota bacterium]